MVRFFFVFQIWGIFRIFAISKFSRKRTFFEKAPFPKEGCFPIPKTELGKHFSQRPLPHPKKAYFQLLRFEKMKLKERSANQGGKATKMRKKKNHCNTKTTPPPFCVFSFFGGGWGGIVATRELGQHVLVSDLEPHNQRGYNHMYASLCARLHSDTQHVRVHSDMKHVRLHCDAKLFRKWFPEHSVVVLGR